LREERKQKIFDMWMACATLEEIAEATQLTKETVSKELETLSDLGQCPISDKVLANFEETETLPDKTVKRLFDPPLYNIWTFSKKTNGVSHFGNSEQRIVDNLLYLYTHQGLPSLGNSQVTERAVHPHPHRVTIFDIVEDRKSYVTPLPT
jgi:hypothetical protein